MQAIDAPEEGDTQRTNPRFEIRSTLHPEVVKSVPLTDFDFDALLTTDWIARLP